MNKCVQFYSFVRGVGGIDQYLVLQEMWCEVNGTPHSRWPPHVDGRLSWVEFLVAKRHTDHPIMERLGV